MEAWDLDKLGGEGGGGGGSIWSVIIINQDASISVTNSQT